MLFLLRLANEWRIELSYTNNYIYHHIQFLLLHMIEMVVNLDAGCGPQSCKS